MRSLFGGNRNRLGFPGCNARTALTAVAGCHLSAAALMLAVDRKRAGDCLRHIATRPTLNAGDCGQVSSLRHAPSRGTKRPGTLPLSGGVTTYGQSATSAGHATRGRW